VDEREVDEQLPGDKEDQVRLERDPVRERTGDQRRRDDREHHLVSDEDDQRDVVGTDGRTPCFRTPVDVPYLRTSTKR